MSIIHAENLKKVYGSGEASVKALAGVSLNVEKGETVLIMGPSGSGKTTLLLILGTLLHPTSGSVQINGHEVGDVRPGELAKLRLRDIGFVFQHFNLLSALTAEENVMVPLLAAGMSRKKAALRAGELLKRFGLENRGWVSWHSLEKCWQMFRHLARGFRRDCRKPDGSHRRPLLRGPTTRRRPVRKLASSRRRSELVGGRRGRVAIDRRGS